MKHKILFLFSNLWGWLFVGSTLLLAAGAEGADDGDGVIVAPEVKVTASREGGALDTMSRNVTVISRRELLEQQEVATSVGDILAKLVPGLAPSSQTLTNTSQTLRGREVLVLIDGVPLNTNRNISRDLFNITPSNIESIEVIHGGSAAYGGGAAGGIIYINTLNAREDGPVFETIVSGGTSLTKFDEDALSGRLNQKVSGKKDQFDYLFSITGDQTQGFFDAEGDRIPPEPSQGDLSDTGTLDFLGKLGYEFGDQRLQFTTSYLDAEQDTDFVSDPSVNAFPPGSVKARALEGLMLTDQTRNENLLMNLEYSKQSLWGSSIRGQAYYRDYASRFSPFDGRPFGGYNALVQTFLEAEVYGGRLTVDTPLSNISPVPSSLLWGFDYNHEQGKQPARIFDGMVFDQSGGTEFVELDPEQTFVPETTTESRGIFGQLELYPLDTVTLRGGVRHEWVDVSFGNFTTLGQGNDIDGGSIDYTETTFNAGIVYQPVSSLDLFANYAQAFELPDIGLQLRFAPVNFGVTDSNLAPRITDNYEIGIRKRWKNMSTSLSAFYSESDLGSVQVENFSLVQQRTPEEIFGIEATADYLFNYQWKAGGTFSWLKGFEEDPATGDKTALNSLRIPPIKVTGYVEYSPYTWWDLRLQALYSGKRDDAFDDGVGFGGRSVDDYTILDLYSRFDAGPGDLRVGIENMLNNQYHTVFGQLLRNSQNTSHLAARGATLRVTYSLQW